MQSYIECLGAHSHGPEPISDDLDRATNYHHEFLGSFLGRYDKGYWNNNSFAFSFP